MNSNPQERYTAYSWERYMERIGNMVAQSGIDIDDLPDASYRDVYDDIVLDAFQTNTRLEADDWNEMLIILNEDWGMPMSVLEECFV